MSNYKNPTRRQCLLYVNYVQYQINWLMDESKDVYIKEDPKKGFLYIIESLKKMRRDMHTLSWGDDREIIALFEKLEIDIDEEEEDSTPE